MSTAAAATSQPDQTESFRARGKLLDLPRHLNAEVCVEGPAGTGKTRGILEYIHLLLQTYPGARWLVARKRNTDLAASAMVTYREEVLKDWDGVHYFGGNKVEPAAFVYPNGSRLIVTGLDKPEKVKSQPYDGAYINEATECTIEEVETVRSRVGRNGKQPFWQLIMDVNPAGPQHWLKRRMDAGQTARLRTVHQDNPRYYNADSKQWTPEGKTYIETNLGGLTGVRYLRLVEGKWAAAEGVVYSEWNEDVHVVPRFAIPGMWPRYMAIDWGYTNPAVVGWWALDSDRRLYCYRELYMSELIVPDLAREVLRWMGYERVNGLLKATRADPDPLPRAIVCDHDKGDRMTFERESGLRTVTAIKDISLGIKALKARLMPAGDGKPRIYYFADCLTRRDKKLADKKLPCSTLEEYDGYTWDLRHAAAIRELPVDGDDHGLDMTRYMVAHFDVKPPAASTSGVRLF